MGLKLNVGASTIWEKEGWYVLDHKIQSSVGTKIRGDAANIDLADETCDIVFCSHVIEHIPHVRLPEILSEVNRVLKPGGVLRILTPNLEAIALAYVQRDQIFFEKALQEDETIRTDLGFGGSFVNFIVSPGQDTVLLDRTLQRFIAGYAHLYCYDFTMLSTILDALGFQTSRSSFCGSESHELREPLHVQGLPPVWEPLNQSFYSKHGLVHRLVDGKYEINFRLTGFDRDPVTSLIVEARKLSFVNKQTASNMFNYSPKNYNRYSRSLLTDPFFVDRLEQLKVLSGEGGLSD